MKVFFFSKKEVGINMGHAQVWPTTIGGGSMVFWILDNYTANTTPPQKRGKGSAKSLHGIPPSWRCVCEEQGCHDTLRSLPAWWCLPNQAQLKPGTPRYFLQLLIFFHGVWQCLMIESPYSAQLHSNWPKKKVVYTHIPKRSSAFFMYEHVVENTHFIKWQKWRCNT